MILRLLREVISKYITTNKIEKDIVSKIKVNFVESIFDNIATIRPELIQNGMNINNIKKCNGYTLFLTDNTVLILIDRASYTESKNFVWIEILIHEYTHAIDYLKGFVLYDYKSLDEMLKNMPFWYWSEFHARYKGNSYMFNFVNQLPLKDKLQYMNLREDIEIYCKDINCKIEHQMKIYKTMHMIADIIAYEESFPKESSKIIIDLQNTFEQFNCFKEFMVQFKDGFNKEYILWLPSVCTCEC